MRRFQALLMAAGLAAAPASALAQPLPSEDSWSRPPTTEWSTARPRLGVIVMDLTPELRKHFGSTDDRGVLIARVEPGTPAAAAGLRVGDVITSVRGQSVSTATDVRAALTRAPKDQSLSVELVRNGKPMTVQATLSQSGPKGVDA